MNAENRLILIEGMDATGKTTLAEELCDDFDAEYIHAPSGVSQFTLSLYNCMLKPFPHIRDDTKLLLFLAGHIETIRDASYRASQNNVICDRSLLSTIAYQNIEFEYFQKVCELLHVPSLPYTDAIVLTAEPSTIVERLTRRKGGKDQLDEFFLTRIDQIHDTYINVAKLMYPNCHIIDTTNKSQQDIYHEVRHKVLT